MPLTTIIINFHFSKWGMITTEQSEESFIWVYTVIGKACGRALPEIGHAFTKLLTFFLCTEWAKFLHSGRKSAKLHVFFLLQKLKKNFDYLYTFPKKIGSKFLKTVPNPVYWVPVTTLFDRLLFTILLLWNVYFMFPNFLQ